MPPKREDRPKTGPKKKKKTLERIPGEIWLIFGGKSVGQNRVLGWSWTLLTPLPNTPNADSSDIIIKPYSFPTFTWIYLIQVLRDKPAFSRF